MGSIFQQSAAVEVPAGFTSTGSPLVIAVNNFGGPAVVGVANPGVWTDAEAAELLHRDDVRRVRAALEEPGYTLIPQVPLWRAYDGVFGPRDPLLKGSAVEAA
jgi:hypothetical protein